VRTARNREEAVRLLDLFCGAGGAAVGYQRAGFDQIVGVDIHPQPEYPFEFVQDDALDYLEGLMFDREDGYFDAVHASPPCQKFTAMKTMHNAGDHADLLTPTRALLRKVGLPYVIENVIGAPMPTAARLCGTSFGLGIQSPPRQLRRHRYFESSVLLWGTECHHDGPTIGIYGDHARDRRRVEKNGEITQRGIDFPDSQKIALAQEALGMPWVQSWKGLSQAIPPAFTEYIGKQLVEQLERVA
jgi:DNA (cytosine-5)-methyltransferase 1